MQPCELFQATFLPTPAMTSGWATTAATPSPGSTLPWIQTGIRHFGISGWLIVTSQIAYGPSRTLSGKYCHLLGKILVW